MNKIKMSIYVVILVLLRGLVVNAQEPKNKIPSSTVKDAYGKNIDTSTLSNNDKPFLICFWKTCCIAPVNMLDAIAEQYDVWVEEMGIILYAVSIDDARSSKSVPAYATSKGWDFVILLDENSEFKRVMNVIMTPHLLLVNGRGEIVWQKSAYFPGDEVEIFEQIKTMIEN